MDNWQINQTIDLVLQKETEKTAFASASVGDRLAHNWNVTVLSSGQPVNLGGATIDVYMKRNDGATVYYLGHYAGNVATVTMPPEVYAIAGTVSGVMKIAKDGITLSAAFVKITVASNMPGEVVDPGNAIPNIEALLGLAGIVFAATDNANSAAGTANTAASTANTAGSNADAATEDATEATRRANSAAERAEAVIDNVNLKQYVVSLISANWEDKKQTVSVPYILHDSLVSVSYATGYKNVYEACGISGLDQQPTQDGELTFSCEYVPDTEVKVNVGYGTNNA